MVYNENNKGPRTEPWVRPNRSLQTSDNVEPIFFGLIPVRKVGSEPLQNRVSYPKLNTEATGKSGIIYGIEGNRQV